MDRKADTGQERAGSFAKYAAGLERLIRGLRFVVIAEDGTAALLRW
jgi:hypothetical protein